MAQVDVSRMLSQYDKDNVTIATICSHSSLQIFHGARKEGFRTLGIALPGRTKFYDAFPAARPDEFFIVNDYKEIMARADELRAKNVIIIPHGSFVEYLGPQNFEILQLPTYGNRNVLEWESNRETSRKWIEGAGVRMPAAIRDPKDIDRPVMVKFHGAKGGKDYFVVKNHEEFMRVNPRGTYSLQEYILGTRYYIHFFYSPIVQGGYELSKGSLQMMGIDRRDETNVDEFYKIGTIDNLRDMGINPTFVVTGNVPVVLRESLLPEVFSMGERVVEKSIELFGGMIGPFCLETIVTDKLKFYVIEISARIVAGTNVSIDGSPYSELIGENISTGQRIAREIRMAIEQDRLSEIIT